jgi:hypothetical protein
MMQGDNGAKTDKEGNSEDEDKERNHSPTFKRASPLITY